MIAQHDNPSHNPNPSHNHNPSHNRVLSRPNRPLAKWLAIAVLAMCQTSGQASEGADTPQNARTPHNPTSHPNPTSFDDPSNPQVRLETTIGHIVIEVFPKLAPQTVANFLAYVDSGYYEGLIFDRVVEDICLYAGRYTPEMEEKKEGLLPEIKYEPAPDLKHLPGVVGLARRLRPDTGRSQFFINLAANPRFDFKSLTPAYTGYTPFGRVVSGWDVVEKIRAVECFAHPKQNLGPKKRSENPVTPVVIRTAERVQRESD